MSVVLDVKNLSVSFPVQGKPVLAVQDVSFKLEMGKVLGIVGESGCGKTVTALSLLRLIDAPGKIVGGSARYYDGPQPEEDSETTSSLESENTDDHSKTVTIWDRSVDLLRLPEDKMRKIRGKKIAMIFQEPMTSLNPVFTVGDQILEAIRLHQDLNAKQARALAIEMLQKVRIPDADKRLGDYPHQMSGGMRQRVMIAMALCCKPDILIADEPTTALDVTIQAQILDLIQELIEELHMSVILITHDLGIVAQVCDEVLVMYAGLVVEQGPVNRIFRMPKHPYTAGLLHSIPPLFDQDIERLHAIAGTVPSLGKWKQGCRFADRCPRVLPACREQVPNFKYVGNQQSLRCINY